jgi:hypothetical protein
MTSNNQQTIECQQIAMRSFLRRSLLFLLPIVVVCVPPVIILGWSGESFCRIEDTLKKLDSTQMLIGYAYNEHNYGYLKHRRLTALPGQSVVALGSSRVLAFQQEMFDCSFYNAGYTISEITDFRRFMEIVPDSNRPKILILGLDQWMFNRKWIHGTKTRETRWTDNSSSSLQKGFKSIPKLYKDLFRGQLRFGQVSSDVRCVGLNAVCHQIGFRNDGSFSYGNRITKLLQTDPLKEDVQLTGNRRFVGGDRVDAEAVKELQRLLSDCDKQGIYVIAFLAPFMDRAYDQMQRSGEHDYLGSIAEEVRPLFRKRGFEFHEFQTMSACGSDDTEAIDALHGSHVTYTRMLLRMLENGSRLSECTNRQQLRADLAARQNRYVVYPE